MADDDSLDKERCQSITEFVVVSISAEFSSCKIVTQWISGYPSGQSPVRELTFWFGLTQARARKNPITRHEKNTARTKFYMANFYPWPNMNSFTATE